MAKKVAVWGRFDNLHKGHLEFLRHARELGDELYVVLVQDEVIEKNKKTTKSAEERKRAIMKIDLVKECFIDSLSRGLYSILSLNPDIFAFGHDQRTKWEEDLIQYLQSKDLHPEYVFLGIYNDGFHSSDLKQSSH